MSNPLKELLGFWAPLSPSPSRWWKPSTRCAASFPTLTFHVQAFGLDLALLEWGKLLALMELHIPCAQRLLKLHSVHQTLT